MLRNGFVIVLVLAMCFGAILSPASAANPTKAKTTASVAAKQAALAQAAKRRHKHHHHKKTAAIGQPMRVVG
jgi:hypothetical protein